MKFLVVSEGNGLHPLARRLVVEGQDVQVRTMKDAFKSCWNGILDVDVAPKGSFPDQWGEVGEEVMKGERTLLTDSQKCRDTFAPHVWGTAVASPLVRCPLMVAAWIGESGVSGAQWFFPDFGLWPGGMGTAVLAGGVLVPGKLPTVLLDAVEELHQEQMTGLALLGVVQHQLTGAWEVVSTEVGWPALLTDLLLWQLSQFDSYPILTEMLAGREKMPSPEGFTVGCTVSLPPWPMYPKVANRRAEEVLLPHLNADLRAQYVFHDFKVAEGKPSTAGTNGLLGTAVGWGRTLARARLVAQRAAQGAELPEPQWRVDVGVGAAAAMVALDDCGLWT